jgi:hypothetical protein
MSLDRGSVPPMVRRARRDRRIKALVILAGLVAALAAGLIA